MEQFRVWINYELRITNYELVAGYN
jgi:hypothetical protein